MECRRNFQTRTSWPEQKWFFGSYSKGQWGRYCTESLTTRALRELSLISDLNDVFGRNFSGHNIVYIYVDLWSLDRDNQGVACGGVVTRKGRSRFPPSQ